MRGLLLVRIWEMPAITEVMVNDDNHYQQLLDHFPIQDDADPKFPEYVNSEPFLLVSTLA